MKKFLLAIILSSAPVWAQSVICGSNTTPGSGSGDNAGEVIAGVACTTGSNAGGYTFSSMSMYITTGTAGGHFQLAVYDSDGASGLPKTLVCNQTANSSFSTVNTWYTVNSASFSACPTLSSNHTYWMAMQTDDATLGIGDTGTGTLYYNTTGFTYGSWSTLSTGWTSYPDTFAMYMTLNPAGGGTTSVKKRVSVVTD